MSTVLPSSRAVGRTMAEAIRQRPAGPVIELGAGTGAVTRQLLKHGVTADLLTCVELDRGFVTYLCATLPGVDVICAPAEELATLWSEWRRAPAGAIVSTLPIRLFPDDLKLQVLEATLSTMAPGAPIVQLTFRPSSPIPSHVLFACGLAAERREIVWANVPPAFVWSYRRAPSPQQA
jgi:phosphatidylethanolamine/phosphatidyl-N-methylethanolamine N-methyltransferase